MKTIIYRRYPLLSAEHPAEAHLLRAMAGILLACTALYVYFVSASVLNVIARSDAQRRAVALEGSIGLLQQQYFDLSGKVSPDQAAQFGLAPISHVSYVHRPGDVGLAPSARIPDNAN